MNLNMTKLTDLSVKVFFNIKTDRPGFVYIILIFLVELIIIALFLSSRFDEQILAVKRVSFHFVFSVSFYFLRKSESEDSQEI